MIMSSLCFRVSLSVSHRRTEPLGVSEQHGSSRASVRQRQQHTAQRRSAAVHPRLQRPSSGRPAVREGEEKHNVIRRAETVKRDAFRRWGGGGWVCAHSGNKLRQVDFPPPPPDRPRCRRVFLHQSSQVKSPLFI